jgi:radical SAM superfamily enzyme YgiQ (UPF0313 family)
MPPTSPPLGIAALKACLQPEAAFEVRNFDLNLAYFEQAFQWLLDGRLRMRMRRMDFDTTAQKAVEARDFFRGKGGDRDFFDLGAYNEQAGVYTGFDAVLNGLFDNFSRRIFLGLPAPSLVSRFFDELIGPLKAFGPDLIGFSVLFSQQLFFALALARLCRESRWQLQQDLAPAKSQRPVEPKIVFGGATFSVMPDPGRLLAGPVPVYLGGERRQGDAGPFIDYLIVGEGEKGLESLASCLASKGGQDAPRADTSALGGIPGLLCMQGAKSTQNPAEAVSNLNDLPLPDFSDFALDTYHSAFPVLPYLASRGCPWRRCAFCTHQKTYLDYREESAEATTDRLSALRAKYGVDHFCLVDEMVHPRRMGLIAANLVKKDAQVYFSAYARPSGFSREILKKAHRAGLRVLMWGLESASQRMLDLMTKGTDAKKIAAVLDAAREAGVWNLLFLIFGFPTETKAEWLETVDFLEANPESVHAVSRSRFILLEGSGVFADPQRYGITRIIDRPQRDPVSIAYDYQVAEGLTQSEADAMFRQSSDRLSLLGRSPWFGRFREHMLLFAARQREGGGVAGPQPGWAAEPPPKLPATSGGGL